VFSVPASIQLRNMGQRPGLLAKAVHSVRPVLEELEKRQLLAFDLHNGVLRETFDEQDVGDLQLVARSGWDDDEYVPATNGSGQRPQLVSPAIPLFHHQITVLPGLNSFEAFASVDRVGGDTTIADNPFIGRALDLFSVTDAITFPDVKAQNNEAVNIAAVDVYRPYEGAISVTFVGTDDSETLTDTNALSSTAPPAVIVAKQGSPGPGTIGVTPGFSAPTTAGWDSLAATRDDIGVAGKPIGPITEIGIASPGEETIDNGRVFVGYLAPPGNSPPAAVDDTGYSVRPGASISIPVLANDSDPDGDPIHLVSVGAAGLGTAAIDPTNPNQVLYTASSPFSAHGPDRFTYTIADKYNAMATATVIVLVNTPPTAPDLTISVPRGMIGSFMVASADGLFSKGVGDADNDKLALTATDGMYGKASLNQDGSFAYTRDDGGLVTADSFQYTVSDGYVNVDGTISLVPDNPHLPPKPTPDPQTYPVPHGYTGSYTSAAPGIFATNPRTDGDGDPLVPIVVTAPTFGTVVFNRAGDGSYDGTFTYTPDTFDNFVLNDTFHYVLSDGYSDSAPATVELVVPNDHVPPTTIQPDTFNVNPGVRGLYMSPAPGIFENNPQRDGDGDPLIPIVDVQPKYGTVVFDRASDGTYDGTFTYTPSAPGGRIPDDSFLFSLTDGYADSNPATATLTGIPPISITYSNESFPYLIEESGGPGTDAFTIAHGTPGPLTADVTVSDAEGYPVTLNVGTQARFGHVVSPLTQIGVDEYQFEYDPPAIPMYDSDTLLTKTVSTINGNDEFTLEASDGYDSSDFTIRFDVPDQLPVVGSYPNPSGTPQNTTFEIPANNGLSYYTPVEAYGAYDPSIDYPGLVHFAAPGMLWDAFDELQLVPTSNGTSFVDDPLIANVAPQNYPLNGDFAWNPDGSFNYTPKRGFVGNDSFAFTVSDGYESSSLAYVTLDVVDSPPSDPFVNAPVLVDSVNHLTVEQGQDSSGEIASITDDNHVADTLGYRYPDLVKLYDYYDKPSGEPITFYHFDDMNSIEAVGPGGVQERASGVNLSYTFYDSELRLHLTAVNRIDDLLSGSGPEEGFPVTAQGPELTCTFSYVYETVTGALSNFAEVTLTLRANPPPQATATVGDIQIKAIPDPLDRTGDYATLVAAGFTPFPNSAPPPGDVQFPTSGLLSFSVQIFGPEGIPDEGAAAVVDIDLPLGFPHVTTYYKYGPSTSGAPDSWYPFIYDPQDGQPTGAEFTTDGEGSEIIVLHLRDGSQGDGDLLENGVISDPGAPAAYTVPARNYVASLYEEVLGRSASAGAINYWTQLMAAGSSRLRVAEAFWNSREHRRAQVEQWSMQFLGHPARPAQRARWVGLLRRGAGETAVEARILTSPDYRRAHPTLASFVAGLNHDVLGRAADPFDPSSARLLRRDRHTSRAQLALHFLTSPAAARLLAQRDATGFLGRLATPGEVHRDAVRLKRSLAAPSRIAERILASAAFYEFVNSALDLTAASTHRPHGH
jgi:hypothetical protein